MCTATMMGVKPMVDAGFKMELLPFLRKKCKDVDNSAENDLCTKFTGENGEELVDMICDILQPETFCTLVRACADTNNEL